MNGKWEAYTNLEDGLSKIVFQNGEELIVRNDGTSGFAFVEEYLEEMRQFYPSHLEAADEKLQMRLGKAYKLIRKMKKRYMAELALVSLNCCFGARDHVLDHVGGGQFNVEFTLCPERYSCPFNGFNPEFRGKKRVCCNPVYECGLTDAQAELADKIVNTAMSYEEMADQLGCSYSNVDNMRRRIFSACGVTTRAELMIRLRGKRLV